MHTRRPFCIEARHFRTSICALFGFLVFVLAALPALCQVSGGSISGTVVDPSQGVIPQARVTARNTATGVESKATTNQTGYYEFPVVVPGSYAITVQAPGFGDAATSTFAVITGQRSQVNVQLKLGSASENIQVSATTQLLNSVSADLGTEVEPQKINNLPLNQRNFFPLIGLQPGVNANSGSTTLNGRGGFEVNGAPGLANNILIDGVDATFGESNSLGSAIGGTGSNINTMSVDAIDEFRTTSGVPSAQYGRASGGILTLTTKSGSNRFHGNLFEYIRNDAFDANTWNNKHVASVVPIPKLRYNDFGGNVGGPILHDKAFFFFNYEGDRQNSSQTMTGDTATAALIASVSNPAIATELSLMPQPNSTTSNPLIGFFTGNRSIALNENVYMGRFDWNVKSHRIMVRYNYNNQAHEIQQFRADDFQGFPLTSQNAAIEDVWTPSANLVNEFRLGLNRNILNRNTTGYSTDPTQSWVILTGFFSSDTTQSLLSFQSTTYGLVDNLTWLHGKHTLRFGTDDRLVPSRRTQFTSPRSTYASIADLQTDTPQSLAVSFGGPKHLISTQWAGYAEDSYRMTPRLTSTSGVRYDYFAPMSGGYNISGDDPFGPLFTNRNHPFMTAGHYDIAPRVGFAYDVTRDHKLVIRSGFGLMFVPPQAFFMFSSAFASPLLPFDASFLPSQVPASFSVKYPISRTYIAQLTADPSLIPPGLTFGRFIAQYHHPEEYSENWNLNAQYQFTPDLYLQAGYVGMTDRHELSTALPNQFLAGTCSTPSCPGGTVPTPSIGVIDYNIFGGYTHYDALQLTFSYRHKNNSADIYYTYASQNQTWDSSGTIGNAAAALQNPNDGKSASGPSDGFQRHRLAGDFLYSLPLPASIQANRFGRAIVGGWSLQGILGFQTGAALNILANLDLVRNGYTSGTRPDYVPETSYYAKGHPLNGSGYETWLNTAAFDATTPYNAHRYGNLGYNAVSAPDAFTFDASIHKQIQIYQEHHLDFRAEAFNALNYSYWGAPNVTVGNPNFGISTTKSNPRNMQFGLRYSF
jgi:hypothetical protein